MLLSVLAFYLFIWQKDLDFFIFIVQIPGSAHERV